MTDGYRLGEGQTMHDILRNQEDTLRSEGERFWIARPSSDTPWCFMYEKEAADAERKGWEVVALVRDPAYPEPQAGEHRAP